VSADRHQPTAIGRVGLVAGLIGLAACARPGAPPVADGERAPITYACAAGVEVRALYSGDSVVVTFPGGKVGLLPHVVSGSGARYSDGTTTWWTKGDSAFAMTGDSVTIRDCGARS
jgi:membrane-bound inhibitor of C-type lysozyme